MKFFGISASLQGYLKSLIDHNQSPLLSSLYTFVDELPNASIVKGPGQGTHASSNNTITVGADLLPDTGRLRFSNAQFVTALSHELSHLALPGGTSTGRLTASDPAAAELIGERAEGEANLSEYVVALQLGLSTSEMQQLWGKPLFAKLQADAAATGLDVSTIHNTTDLEASAFYQQNILDIGQAVAGVQTSDARVVGFTYKATWDDSWALFKIYNVGGQNVNFPALTPAMLKVQPLPGGGWTFTGTNIPLIKGASGIGNITANNETLSFQASETSDGVTSKGVWTVLTPTTATINGGSENDVLYAHAGLTNNFVFSFGENTSQSPVETIVCDPNGKGSLSIVGFLCGSVAISQTGADNWTDGTYNYHFVPWSNIPPGDFPSVGLAAQHDDIDVSQSVGELVITPVSSTGRQTTINVLGFNLQQAQNTGLGGGFLGLVLPTSLTLSQVTNAGAPVFTGGTTQTYQLSVNAPSTTAQSIVVTLSGAVPADFGELVGNIFSPLPASKSFIVTLAAGMTTATFSLIDAIIPGGLGDLSFGGPLTLTASLSEPNVPGGVVQSGALTFNYLPQANDTSTPPPAGTLISGGGLNANDFLTYIDTAGNTVTVGGSSNPFHVWQTQGEANASIAAGTGPNWIDASDSSNDNIVGGTGINYVAGGSGNVVVTLHGSNDVAYLNGGYNTVYGGTGLDTVRAQGGHALIVGNGGTDVIYGTSGDNEIYAGAQVGLSAAIANTQAALATQGRGDLITLGDGDNTVVGGTGNDLVVAGSGHDVIVLGSGNDTFRGGWELTNVQTNWSASVTPINGGFSLEIDNVDGYSEPYTNPYPQPYHGLFDPSTGQPSGPANDTIFAGNGNDLIELGNGDSFIQGGSGNDTILAGMGNDTIMAGSGNTDIGGGGGNHYIYGGAGADTLYGGNGNNTIIGGSGNSTIYSAHGSAATYTGANLEQNYVFGGSGNDLIVGSAGNDTLVAGSGNTSIQGGLGSELIIGGTGNDSLVAGTGNATLEAGGSGTDTLVGGSNALGTYFIYGGGGVDSIVGGAGTNILFAGDGGTAGTATTVIAGQATADTLVGGAGVALLIGGAGSNVIYAGDGNGSTPTTLIAGSGASTLYGGSGTDVIQGGSGADVLFAGDGGVNTPPTTVSAGSGLTTLYGGAGAAVLQDLHGGSDLIISTNANDTLTGIGHDTLVAGLGDNYMQGLGGSVTIEATTQSGGNATVSALGGVANLVFGDGITSDEVTGSVTVDASGTNYLLVNYGAGTIALAGALTGSLASVRYLDPADPSVGTFLNQVLDGDQTIPFFGSNLILSLANQETVTAGSGSDTISSWGTNSTLLGGTTNSNTDLIFSAGDSASIVGGQGVDSIEALGDDSSVVGGVNGNAVTLGGAGSLFTGTTGQDLITISGTSDTVIAGSGHSQFFVNGSSAVIEVSAAAAGDSIVSTVTYTAPTNVNTLTLSGTADIAATGNSGNDSLTGGAGDDTLIAGSGTATLIGGTGNTTFVVNDTGDVVQDSSASTNNQIQSSVSYTLPTHVNTLVLTGSGNLTATANSGDDTLVSNSGIDTLIGGSGHDTFIINNPADVIVPGSGTTTILFGSAGGYTLPTGPYTLALTGTANLVATAGSGNDTLISNTGIDTLYGGSGNDTFVIQNGADVVVDTSSASHNTIDSSVSYSLPTNVNTLILTGSAALTATGNSGDDLLQGNAGSSTLVSGSGISTLVGSSGSDVFIVNNSADIVQSTVAGTHDTLIASVSISLPSNIDTLVLIGTSNLAATANSDNDTLVSNGGIDTLIGGSGDETYIISNSADVVQDHSNDRNSTVQSSVSYTLPDFVTTLVLTGTADLEGTANNDTNDSLIGNAGADTLVGGQGSDTLIAGTGVDTLIAGQTSTIFVVNNTADVVENFTSFATSIFSSVSYVLPSTVHDLILTGSANLTGSALSGNNSIVGNQGNDVLQAGSGTDTLVAGGGIATLLGGSGADTFVINDTADVIASVSSATGNAILSSVSYSLPTGIDVMTLSGTDDLIAIGNDDADSITAGAGNDTLVSGTGITTLVGGQGSDLFVVNNSGDVVSNPDYGTSAGSDSLQSSVSFSLPTGVNALQLTGTADLAAIGNAGSDLMVGNSGNDTLIAGIGNTTLVAGTGLATLIGSTGNDTFVINDVDDVVEDSAAASNNVVMSAVTYTLPTDINTLILEGSANLIGTGNAADDSIVGNAGADTLVAGTGNDTLVAGSGLDTFIGGSGNDAFIVNDSADVIENASATSSNAVLSSSSFSLPTNVNALTLIGDNNSVGTGNAGSDTLIGASGRDTLIAGSGLATLIGGTGDTTFVVDDTADVVVDSYTSSANAVQSSVDYTLPTNVNTLILEGPDNLRAGANDGTDTLISNAAVDTLIGGSGNDTFVVNNTADVIQDTATTATNVVEASVSYSLAGNLSTLELLGTADLTAVANNGNDTLISNAGTDTLVGGTGNDTFIVSNAADVVVDTATTAQNSILSSVSYSLPTNVNALTLIGTAALSVTGNTAADLIQANSGGDTLVAGTGAATLVGGAGADLFVVTSTSDLVQAGDAADTIQSSVNYTLPGAVSTLVLTGTASLLAQAGSGADTLVSNSGVDTLIAGSGPDVLVVNNSSDVIENLIAGDTIEAYAGYTLGGANAILSLMGTAAIAATANATGDLVTGNLGQDTLVAQGASDTLVGNSGTDTFVIGAATDVVEENLDSGNNALLSSVSYTLPENISALTLTGSANATIVGNDDASNTLAANSGNDQIIGVSWSNTIYGGTGGDTIQAGSGLNLIYAGDGGTVSTPTFVMGNSSAVGTWTESEIYGGSGFDLLYGGAGSDLITTGSGISDVYAGSGTETIVGAAGSNNALFSGAGTNLIYGGAGTVLISDWSAATTSTQSTVYGGSGATELEGGPGTDLIITGSGNDTVRAGSGFETIDGSSGTNTLYGGIGSNVIEGGAGTQLIYAGRGSNLISLSGGGGSSVAPLIVRGDLNGTDTSTHSTIYGGSGTDLLYGGPGTDLIYGGTGTESIYAGTGTDTLIAGSGNELLQAAFSPGESAVYEINPGFGQVTLWGGANDVTDTASENIDDIFFGSGLNPGSFTISAAVHESPTVTSAADLYLVLADGSSSVAIRAGLSPDVIGVGPDSIGSVVFADTGAISITQLVQQDGVGTQILSDGGSNDEFSTSNAQSITASSSIQGIYAYGNNDTLTQDAGFIDAYGNSDVLTGTNLFAGGTGDVVNLLNGGSAIVAGANTTVIGSGHDAITVEQLSTVIQASGPAASNSVVSYVDYTLPTDVGFMSLQLDSLLGASNAQGGHLVAVGNYDTLLGGTGSDTLDAEGLGDVLVGGSGSDTYILTDTSDSIVWGTGAASVTAVQADFSYTLGSTANTLTETGDNAVAVGNGANDLLTATGTGDTLVAGAGNDTLVSLIQTKNNTLVGGSGNDTFEIDNAADVIVDTATATNNVVVADTSYTLPVNVNALILTGPSELGAANGANDSLVATAFNETLVAGSGNDTLVISPDGSGQNVIVVGAGTDLIEDQSTGQDTVEFNAGFGTADIATLGAGDVIQFGTGIARSDLTFTPLSGADAGSFAITGAGGAITVQGGLAPGAVSGVRFVGGSTYSVQQLLASTADTTIAGIHGNLILSSISNDAITGGTGADTLIAWGNTDTLTAGAQGTLIYAEGTNTSVTGGTGADTLVADGNGDTITAGSGNQTLIVNNGNATVQASAGLGSDTLYASVSYNAPDNVNIVTLTGTRNLEVWANSANDLITGNSAWDTFVGGGGADTFIAGTGSNTFIINNTGDVVEAQPSTGIDSIQSSVSYSLPANVDCLILTGSGNLTATGNANDDLLISNFGNDLLQAGSGNDTLQTYYDGFNFTGIVTLVGGAGADSLFAGNGSGGDVIISGTGIDTLVADEFQTLIINNSADVLQLNTSGQIPDDTIESSVSYTLAADSADNDPVFGTEASINWTLLGSGSIAASAGLNNGDFTITGNAGADTLTGGSGSNDLIAGTGIDTLISGGAGSTNLFTVNNTADVIIAQPGTSNRVAAFTSYSLPSILDHLYLKTLGLLGTGNSSNDYLEADGGSDTLVAGSGNDTLDSSAGTNTLVGGTGADVFFARAGDTVELVAGFNQSQISVSGTTSATTVQFGAGITASNLTAVAVVDANGKAALAISTTAGAVTLDGALAGQPYQFRFDGGAVLTLGQFLSQVTVTTSSVTGASGNVVLEGNPSVALTGGSGNDTIYAAAASDVITGGTGHQLLAALGTGDSLIGGTATDTLSGLGTNDTLVAGSAVDTLIGGTGATIEFVINNTGDVIQLQSSPGADTVASSVNYTLPANLNTLVLTAAGLKGSANSSGADTLISSTVGVDTLAGGAGNETFIVNVSGDVVTDTSTTAHNTVQSSVSFSLPSNVNTLILTGSGTVSGTGNSAADLIVGNTGIDTLTAVGTNATTLMGGGGTNTFVVVNTKDVVSESVAGTGDLILSSVNFTLPTNVNALQVTGATAVLVVANNGNDSLTANNAADTLSAAGTTGNDTLVSGTAKDSLVGGTGHDVFVVNNSTDVVTVTATGTNDTIQSSVSFTLPTNVQYLMFTGTSTISGTGNSLTDLIVGNAGTDTLTGGTGIAVLEGGTGSTAHDTLKATGNQAAFIGGGGGATVTGGAFKDFYATGTGPNTITTGATANVIAVNKGNGATTLGLTTGASDVLSLGAGIDTEALTFTKSGNNLILNDGVTGDSITFTSWYANTANTTTKTLQVVEIASSSYNASGTDALRNKALEEFNFTTLVAAFNSAGQSAGWALSNDMSAAALTSSATAAYGGDLAYYDGLNGHLTGMNLSAAQATLTNSGFATATQAIDPFSSISGSGGGLQLLAERPSPDIQPAAFVDPIQLAWLSADTATPETAALLGGELDPPTPQQMTSTLIAASSPALARPIETLRTHTQWL